LGKLDVDNPELGPVCQELQVSSIPAFFIFYDGKVLGKHVGALPEDQVQEMVKAILNHVTENPPGQSTSTDK